MRCIRKMKECVGKTFDFEEKRALVKAVERYLTSGFKADSIFEKSFYADGCKLKSGDTNAVFKTLLRNLLSIENIVSKLCKKPPRSALKSALYCACADILSRKKAFQSVDSWVEFVKTNFSKGESGFLNAVLRKFPAEFEKILEDSKNSRSLRSISLAYSHPEWLVKKWIDSFGLDKTLEILKNDQNPSCVFLRSSGSKKAKMLESEHKNALSDAPFKNFKILKSGEWESAKELLESGEFYIQDPSTSFAPSLLNPKFGECVLDLCASPGGKSRLCADLIRESANFDEEKCLSSTLVSVDIPGPRIGNLRENISKINFLKTYVLEADLNSEELAKKLESSGLPLKFDCVLLDAPCSNTGVLRRRPDARYRLSEGDISKSADFQKKLISKAGEFVRPGGRFVYSTCSIEPEENEENANWFLRNFPEFKLVCGGTSLPNDFKDGSGSFLFERNIL